MLSKFSSNNIKINTQLNISSQLGVYRVNTRFREGVK
jgi:hypothetical protein